MTGNRFVESGVKGHQEWDTSKDFQSWWIVLVREPHCFNCCYYCCLLLLFDNIIPPNVISDVCLAIGLSVLSVMVFVIVSLATIAIVSACIIKL